MISAILSLVLAVSPTVIYALPDSAACLKGHEPAAHGVHSQQEKMKTCNQEARERDLHGDERRAFMSSCLKG